MRIFNAFLIILGSVILLLLPLTGAIYDFRTDSRTDTFSTTTGVGVTTANETLLGDLYDCDMGSIDIDSDNATENPLASSVNCTSRVLLISNLAANTTRILDITYDVGAFEVTDAINDFLDFVPWIWILLIVAFAPAALVALFTNRA